MGSRSSASARRALDAVAAALTNGELARAQIAALLLQLPDPPPAAIAQPDGLEKRRLARDLAACGLLKADADWDDKHPRTGAPPNPGWFAPTAGGDGGGHAEDKAEPDGGRAVAGDAALGLCLPRRRRPASVPLLAEDLSATALRGLATLAARFSAATILFDAIFVPSDNRLVEEGRLPGRPDIAYRWAHDETETAVTLKVLVDGQWRTLAVGGAAPNGLVYADDGRAVARVISGPDRRQTLVATVGALDRAVANCAARTGASPRRSQRQRAETLSGPEEGAGDDEFGQLDRLSGIRQRTALPLGDMARRPVLRRLRSVDRRPARSQGEHRLHVRWERRVVRVD